MKECSNEVSSVTNLKERNVICKSTALSMRTVLLCLYTEVDTLI